MVTIETDIQGFYEPVELRGSGLLIINPKIFKDSRGYFFESYS